LRRLASVAVAAALVATVLVTPVLPAPPAAAAPALPSGFVLQDLPTGMTPPSSSGPGDLLTDFAYLPDESIVAIGKYGKVTWISATGATRRLASLSVNAAGDLGLIGVAVAPDYATSHAIYTARALPSTAAGSGDSGLLRLSRWTVELDRGGDPAGLGAETTVLETSADSHWHSVGSVVADMDGSLWLSIGDSADWRIVDPLAFRALDRDDLHGKLLHLTPDGAGVPSNPFYDPAAPRTARSLVYALGFRSPLRFGLDSSTGLPVLGDVGSSTYEEVDLVRPGYSYGWPCWEANAPTPGWKDAPECVGVTTTKPVWAYPHNGSGSAVTGGLVYTGKNYPSGYQGRYFFGDYVDKVIWTMSFDGTATVTRPPESAGFATDIGQPVSFRSAPSSGDLVYADISSATIRRLVYAPGNTAPKAVLSSTADPDTRTVTFDTGGSSDPNGDPLVFAWDFGDGTTGTGATVQHTYAAQPDEFTVRLTATDPLGASSSTTATIYPGNHPPSLDVRWPDLAATYAVGDLVKAAATASDSEDGPLTVTWSSRVAHCYTLTDCHDHYGAVRSGPTFELAFEGHGR
jgi:glucose/arabinose dehydrogenase